MIRVDIGRSVEPSVLEQALTKAAKKLGWKVKVQDQYEQVYILGSVHKGRIYQDTCAILRGILFKKAEVSFNRRESRDYFFIDTEFPFEIASERQLQAYLSAVSENLPSA